MDVQLTYRLCVGIMLVNSEDRVFVGRRGDAHGDTWQMPQGGIEMGETPEEAAFRELLEEVGTNNAIIEHKMDRWLHYDIPESMMPRSYAKRRYKGQKQLWFLMRFLGKDSEININVPNPEFGAWKWANIGWLADNIVYFKKELYKEVVEDFSRFLRNNRPESH